MYNKENPDLWPTPEFLARKMASLISGKRCLEPSAGHGNIADIIKENRYVDCIEIDPRNQEVLIGKGHRVIDSDFLKYEMTTQYDCIVMNPPFREGAKHLLKAIDIMYNGRIIAQLNAETIRNPYTEERKLLIQKIEDLGGSIEYIENAYIDADRKTNVEIALVVIDIQNSIERDYFSGMSKTSKMQEPEFIGSDIAIPDSQIENYVFAYHKALEIKKEALIKTQEAEYYAGIIGASFKDENRYRGDTVTEMVQNSFNEQVEYLRESAWSKIINLADFHKHLTDKVRKEIYSQMDIVKNLEFTVENIRTFLMNLIQSRSDIMNDCVLEVFDEMTKFFHWDKYHEQNRAHVEGWKSNERWFVNHRVVLPYLQEHSWGQKGARANFNKFEDIEKAVRYVEGEPVSEDSIQNVIFEKNGYGHFLAKEFSWGSAIVTKYFKIRMYKKGTTHFYWRDKKVLERFNLFVGRQRQWLPKEDAKVPKEFWLMCENNC